MAKTVQLRCPICKNPVKRSDPDFPFCSERCRTIDLGKWASGQYVISSPVKDTADEFEQQSEADRSDDD
ncbi:MAG TPA: DNA gyrase inhibitor YacG [Terriglobales bacterium]|nr:DNA gyrase inhibitor YacG [Terriglobales bacterium]